MLANDSDTDHLDALSVSAFDGTSALGATILLNGDGTLRYVWDDDSRSYKTQSAVSITLLDVREVEIANGAEVAPVYDYDPQNVAGGQVNGIPTALAVAGGHAARITVTFPIQETTKAFDGFCWLGNLRNEEALNYATRQSGLILAPRIEVEVIGVVGHVGPFKWIGMPAYRIPVGSTYAHPAADILQHNWETARKPTCSSTTGTNSTRSGRARTVSTGFCATSGGSKKPSGRMM